MILRAIHKALLAGMLFVSAAQLSTVAFADSSLEQGKALYYSGEYQKALGPITRSTQSTLLVNDIPGYVESSLYLADTYNNLANPVKAINILQNALQVAAKSSSILPDDQYLLIYLRLANSSRQIQAYDESAKYLDKARALSTDKPVTLSMIENDQGLLHVAQKQYAEAEQAFEASAAIAMKMGGKSAAARATLNLAKLAFDDAQLNKIESRLKTARDYAIDQPDSADKAYQILTLGKLYSDAEKEYDMDPVYRRKAYDLYIRGLSISKRLGYKGITAYGLGYLGLLYEQEGRYKEALAYARQATDVAQKIQDNESLYQWEWLTARSQWQLGSREESVAAYGRAVDSLQNIRNLLLSNQDNSYQKIVGPLYYQYADYQLRLAIESDNDEERREKLTMVRDVLEEVKKAELQDYFRDECAVINSASEQGVQATKGAATLYPVLLDNRLELLLSDGSGIYQYSSDIGSAEITQLIREFRLELQNDTGTKKYLTLGKELYDHLIGPMEKHLAKQKIETLVIVPDGALRTIPLGALYDGEKFLIESYAVATTPGLTLTESAPLAEEQINVLAGGLTVEVEGWAKLDAVEDELKFLSREMGATVMQGTEFNLAAIEQGLGVQDYSVVHFATHGKFKSDYSKSFLQAADGEFTMGMLEKGLASRQLNGGPLDLLVLSACETAAGDDRAALGLAGVALQAGARSALATLWLVSDKATSQLVEDFYQQLTIKSVNKAESLRRAQLKLLEVKDFRHPSIWAPFLLIGNWS